MKSKYVVIASAIVMLLYGCGFEQYTDSDSIIYNSNNVESGSYKNEYFLYPIKKDGKYAFINRKGEIVVEGLVNDRDIYGILCPAYGVVNMSNTIYNYLGENITDKLNQYDSYDEFYGGIATVSHDEKWGYVDVFANEITDIKYTKAGKLINGLAVAIKTENLVDLVNNEGKIKEINRNKIVRTPLDNKPMFSNYTITDESGKTIMFTGLDNEWNNGMRIAYNNAIREKGTEGASYMFLDMNNKVVISEENLKQYKLGKNIDKYRFYNDLAYVENEQEKAYIDKTGKKVIDVPYDDAQPFSCNRAIVTSNGKSGVIDTSGKLIVVPKYDYIFAYSENIAGYLENGFYGFMDLNGDTIIEPQFKQVGSFHGGICQIQLEDNQFGYIDLNGNYIWGPTHDWYCADSGNKDLFPESVLH